MTADLIDRINERIESCPLDAETEQVLRDAADALAAQAPTEGAEVRAERDQLLEQLAAAQREVIGLRAELKNSEEVRAFLQAAASEAVSAALESQAQPKGTDAPCPRCDGSGEITVMSDGGPDAYEVPMNCDHCGGTGALGDAYAQVAKRLEETDTKYTQLYGKVYFNRTDADLLRQAVEALEYHQEQTRPIQQTINALANLKRRLDSPLPSPAPAQVTDDMRSAVRWAASSAYWSERLHEFFGPDAREGINALERQLSAALNRVPAVVDGALAKLLAHHAGLLEHNSYAYFELAYTRSTGWMAWITDKPAKGEPGTAEYARSRKVIARGQGDTPEEAAADALTVINTQEGEQS